MLIKATVQFTKFEYLENTQEQIDEIFALPDDCELVSRKEGMKILQNKKKRLAYANIVT